MTDSEKIDTIFSKVSKIETSVALINERHDGTEKWKNSHEGRTAAIEQFVMAYKIERAKLLGVAVATGTIFGTIGSFIVWLFGLFKH